MTAYYNEIDREAVATLRELIKAGLIAPGEVDDRSIEDVCPNDLLGFSQCHFFAGHGVWSYALRLAGWPDDRPVWTGSCPCQPFSAAGKGLGFADERHLWPLWFWLVKQRHPVVIFGEQSASKGGRTWFDLVSTDMESQKYTCGAVSTLACGFGAPHKRQRLYWISERMADSKYSDRGTGEQGEQEDERGRWNRPPVNGNVISLAYADRGECHGLSGGEGGEPDREKKGREQGDRCASSDSQTRIVANPDSKRQPERKKRHSKEDRREQSTSPGNDASGRHGHGGLADAGGSRLEEWEEQSTHKECQAVERSGHTSRPGPINGFWRDADWLICNDPDGPRWRPVEPGTFPLANGAPSRVGRIRGYGNAINVWQAKAFIEAYIEVTNDQN